jgi:hypothetical protein
VRQYGKDVENLRFLARKGKHKLAVYIHAMIFPKLVIKAYMFQNI